ncbi:hypothetical protein GCM10009700_35130 [Brevibacterium sanguinis]
MAVSELQDILNKANIPTPPKGWNSGATFDGTEGEATSKPMPVGADFEPADVLRENGFDPDLYEIDGLTFSIWDAQTKEGTEKFTSRRFKFRRKALTEELASVDDLLALIAAAPKPPRAKTATADNVTVFAVGDLQLGKGNGDGTEGIVRRFLSSLASAVGRYNEAPTGSVLIAFLGDCIEGVVSQGGRNIGENDLSLTDQLKVLRHLMTQTILQFEETGARLTILSVAGNHDEPYRSPVNAKPTDSFAIDSLRAVEEAFSLAGRSGLTFVYPKESELAVFAEVGGVRFLAAHGHQWRTGKHYAWWQGQSFSRQTGHDAQWLLSGHRHHFFIDTESDRYFLQVPALEERSDWWRNKTGQVGNPGAVYLEIEPSGAHRVIALVQ